MPSRLDHLQVHVVLQRHHHLSTSSHFYCARASSVEGTSSTLRYLTLLLHLNSAAVTRSVHDL